MDQSIKVHSQLMKKPAPQPQSPSQIKVSCLQHLINKTKKRKKEKKKKRKRKKLLKKGKEKNY
jgi:hypothetical protein